MSNNTTDTIIHEPCRCNEHVQHQPYTIEWSKLLYKGDSIESRGSHSCNYIIYNNVKYLLIYGGNNRYGVFYDDIYLYNVNNNTVEKLTTDTSNINNINITYRSGHTTYYDDNNNSLYIFGGQYIYVNECNSNANNEPQLLIHDTILKFSLDNKQWFIVIDNNELSSINCASSIAVNNIHYTVGGAKTHNVTNQIIQYEINNNNHNTKLSVNKLNINNLPAVEMSSVTMYNNNTLLLTGGKSNTSIYDNMYLIDLTNYRAIQCGRQPIRCGHTMIAYPINHGHNNDNDDNQQQQLYDILLFGGFDGQQFRQDICRLQSDKFNNNSNNTLQCSNCNGSVQWIECDDTNNNNDNLPAPRVAHTLTHITDNDNSNINTPQQQYILFGGLNESNDFSDMYLLTIKRKL